jgi:hypothetical protein
VSNGIEQPSSRRSALLEVIGLRGINLQLPEMVVLLRDKSIVYARELATDAEQLGWFDTAVGIGFRVKNPAESV